MNLNSLQALNTLGTLKLGVIPSLAVDLLKSGLDSPSLRILAGLEPFEEDDINKYLKKTFNEFKVPSCPDKKTAGMIVAKDIAGDIVQGKIDPFIGARKIWWEVWNVCGRPRELDSFVVDATDYEETYPRDQKILDSIVSNAKELINN